MILRFHCSTSLNNFSATFVCLTFVRQSGGGKCGIRNSFVGCKTMIREAPEIYAMRESEFLSKVLFIKRLGHIWMPSHGFEWWWSEEITKTFFMNRRNSEINCLHAFLITTSRIFYIFYMFAVYPFTIHLLTHSPYFRFMSPQHNHRIV